MVTADAASQKGAGGGGEKPSRSRPNGARRPYLRSGFHTAKRAAGALVERAADESVPDAELSPVELEAREWTRAVVKRVGRKRITPVVEDRILLAGALRIVVFTTLDTVRDLAVRGRLVNKKKAQFRPLTREWPELAKRYLDLAGPLDLPPELESADLRSYLNDPTKPWNRRERGDAGHGAGQEAARTCDREETNTSPPAGPQRPEEGSWSV